MSNDKGSMDELRGQIRALQEQLAFTDHASDQISGELVRAFSAIQSLSTRLDRVEARLGEVMSSVEERLSDSGESEGSEAGGALDGLELPPHSMGDRAERVRDAEAGR
jgi:chromosome segregation ATPase